MAGIAVVPGLACLFIGSLRDEAPGVEREQAQSLAPSPCPTVKFHGSRAVKIHRQTTEITIKLSSWRGRAEDCKRLLTILGYA